MSKLLQLKFEDKQEHQLQAIASTVNLFSGMPSQDSTYQMGDEIVSNLPPFAALDESRLLSNLNEVCKSNGLDEQQ